jgi:hypothetical protein
MGKSLSYLYAPHQKRGPGTSKECHLEIAVRFLEIEKSLCCQADGENHVVLIIRGHIGVHRCAEGVPLGSVVRLLSRGAWKGFAAEPLDQIEIQGIIRQPIHTLVAPAGHKGAAAPIC